MVVEALRQQACGGRQVYIIGKGGEHCTVRMGMPKKPEVREREVEASVVKRCPAGLPCSGTVGAGVFPVGEKKHPVLPANGTFASGKRIQKCGWVEERTACKEKPHTAIRVRQNSFEKHFPKCP
jgi:hypothetical protein